MLLLNLCICLAGGEIFWKGVGRVFVSFFQWYYAAGKTYCLSIMSPTNHGELSSWLAESHENLLFISLEIEQHP